MEEITVLTGKQKSHVIQRGFFVAENSGIDIKNTADNKTVVMLKYIPSRYFS